MGRFLRDLSVLAAVTAAGGFALTHAVSPPPFEPVLALDPVFARETRTPLTDAIQTLRNAPGFAGACGVVPTTVTAWVTILYDPAAELHFIKLLHSATPAGRAYALAGLRARDLALFHEAARPFRRSRMAVTTVFGCLVSTMTTAQIVAALENGTWIGHLVSASRSRSFDELPWPQ